MKSTCKEEMSTQSEAQRKASAANLAKAQQQRMMQLAVKRELEKKGITIPPELTSEKTIISDQSPTIVENVQPRLVPLVMNEANGTLMTQESNIAATVNSSPRVNDLLPRRVDQHVQQQRTNELPNTRSPLRSQRGRIHREREEDYTIGGEEEQGDERETIVEQQRKRARREYLENNGRNEESDEGTEKHSMGYAIGLFLLRLAVSAGITYLGKSIVDDYLNTGHDKSSTRRDLPLESESKKNKDERYDAFFYSQSIFNEPVQK